MTIISWEGGGRDFTKKVILEWLNAFPECSIDVISRNICLPAWIVRLLISELLQEQSVVKSKQGRITVYSRRC